MCLEMDRTTHFIYRTAEEKAVERYKARVQIGEDHKYIPSFKRILNVIGLNEQAKKFWFGVV